jgi:predicted RNA-binding protein with TRAM domain
MEIPDHLACLFSVEVEQQEGSYLIEVPADELRLGEREAEESYRVAMMGTGVESEPQSTQMPESDRSVPDRPVTEGEVREVVIENVGDEGDGITRVERGFVVIVPETSQDERVSIEITNVRDTVAFAKVVERLSDTP